MTKTNKYLIQPTKDERPIYKKIQYAISSGNIEFIKNEFKNGADVHYKNDYYLYLSIFHKQEEITRLLLDLGAKPEVTEGRLALHDIEGLAKLKLLHKEITTRKTVDELESRFSNNNPPRKTLKI